MAADNQIEVLLTANFSDLQNGMNGAQASVQQGTDAMKSSFQSMQRDMATVQATIGGNIRSMEELAVAETALDRLQQQGALSAAELAAAFKALDAAETKLAAEATVATGAIGRQAVATAQLGVINGGVAREMGVLFGEAVRGNWTRLEGSTVTLANRMNLLQYAFTPVGLAVGAVAAAVGVFAYQVVEAQKVDAEFNAALLSTGYAAGVSTQGLHEAAAAVHSATGNYSGANEAMLAIAKSGRFTSEQLFVVGRTAVEMSQLTGESVEKVVKKFESLQEDPVKAVIKLNDEYHFLTVAVFNQIDALQKQGDANGAAEIAMNSLASVIHQRALEAQEDAGNVLRAWRSVVEFMGNVKGMIAEWGTREERLRTLMDERLAIQQSIKDAEDPTSLKSLLGYGATKNTLLTKEAEKTKEINKLLKEQEDAADAAAKAGRDAARTAEFTHNVQAQEAFNRKLSDGAMLQDKLTEARKRAEAIHAVDPGNAAINGMTFDANGALTGGKQWETTVKKLTKEYDKVGEAADAAAARASKASARAAAAANKHAMEAAQQAQKWRQQDSTDLLKNIAKESATRKQLDQIDLASARDTALAKQALRSQQASADLGSGKINAQQLAAIEQDVADKKLAILIKYYTDKKKLDDKDVVAQKRDDAAILTAMQANAAKQLAIDNKLQQELRKNAQKSADTIKRSMSGAFTGMLLQGQTFGSAMRGLFTTIAQVQIEKGIESLFNHQAVETGKTAATVTGNTVRTASDVASTGTAMALTSQKGIQSIMTSGAEVIGRVWASIAAIPYIGPFLAPAMALAAGAAVYKLASSIPSASGGWGQVPADTLAQIHKDEMVLPADLAKGVRNMTSMGGGQRGGDTYIIKANDAHSFKQQMRRNPSAITAGIKRAQSRGHFAGIGP